MHTKLSGTSNRSLQDLQVYWGQFRILPVAYPLCRIMKSSEFYPAFMTQGFFTEGLCMGVASKNIMNVAITREAIFYSSSDQLTAHTSGPLLRWSRPVRQATTMTKRLWFSQSLWQLRMDKKSSGLAMLNLQSLILRLTVQSLAKQLAWLRMSTKNYGGAPALQGKLILQATESPQMMMETAFWLETEQDRLMKKSTSS